MKNIIKSTKLKKILILMATLIFLSLCLSGCPKASTLASFCIKGFSQLQDENYQKYKPYSDYFGPAKIKFSTIAYNCTENEINTVKSIMDSFEKTLAYTGTKDSSDKNIGALKRFYCFSDEWNYDSLAYDAKLITTKQSGKNGYMWVTYSVNHYDKNGEIVHGSKDSLCYFKIKKMNNQWTVVDILETV